MHNFRLIGDIKKNIYLIFFPTSAKIISIKKEIYMNLTNIFNKLENGEELETIEKEYITKINEFGNLSEYTLTKGSLSFYENKLDKLVLCITRKCNMSCTYCYENEFESFNKNFNYEFTVKNALNKITKQYKYINNIQLFGGEPLLNLERVEYACEMIHKAYKARKLLNLPSIGLITNGTLIDSKTIDLIKKFDIIISISLDGKEKVHDNCRVYKNKKGTYKNILDNIKLLQKNGIKLAGIECTYNYSHVSENVSISDLIEFISNEIGTSNIHIAPLMEIGGVKGNLWQKYSTGMIEAIDDMFEKKVFTETTKVMLIRLLEKHDIDFYCGAGITQFSVDVDGELYPCFMFFGEENFKMGNVNNKMFDIKKLNIRKEKYIKNSKLSKKECINCHIKPVCGGCIGSNYFQFKDIGYINKADCNCKEKIFDKILLNIYKKNKSTVEGIK